MSGLRQPAKPEQSRSPKLPGPLDVWLRNGNDMNLTIYHFVLIMAFIGIVLWVFARKRKARFERDARIPFEEDKD